MTSYSHSASLSRLTALLALSTAVAGLAVAQGPNVTCATLTQSPVVIRNEGKTEQVANYAFQCTNFGTSAASATISATFSQTVTSKVISTGSGQTEATLQILDTTGQQATVYVQGTVSGGVITFQASIPVSTNTSNSQPFDMTIVNARVDATGNAPNDAVNETVAVSGTGITPVTFPAAQVATVQSGLSAQTVTSVTNYPTNTAISAGSPGFILHFGENSASLAAFKVQGSSNTNIGIATWQTINTETGYYVAGTTSNSQANAGTRVRVLFTGIPNGLSVYVPTNLQSDQGASGNVSLTASEAGAFSAVPPSSNPTGYTGQATLALLSVTAGAAEAVYEVTSDNNGVAESYSVPVYVASSGPVSPGNAITATISFAPVGAASNIPNFSQLSDTTTLSGSSFLGITTSSLPPAVQQTSYSATISAVGGVTPYFWRIISGTQPTGLTINSSTGVLSGTSSAAPGNYSFTVGVNDQNSLNASQAYTVTVDAPVSISSGNPPTGAVNESYTNTFTAQGGFGGPYIWTLATGALPPGLTLSSGGVLSGTPTASGSYNFNLQAQDSGSGATGGKAFSQTINTALTVTTTSFPVGVQGTAYPAAGASAQFSGGASGVTWSLASGSFNGTGLSFSNSGVITGTPTAAGNIGPFTIKVTDSGASATSSPITVTVNGPLTLTTTSITPAGLQNQAMTPFQLVATGGSGGNSFGIINSGSLPNGVSISSSGVVSGTPTQSGSFTVYPRVTDSYGDSVNNGPSTAPVTWTVNPGLAITQTSIPSGTLQQAYSQTFTATGGSGNSANYVWSSIGLPPGLSISPAGVLSGTPTSGGNFTGITISVTDSTVSQTANLSNQTLTINYPTLTITTPATLPAGTDNQPYSTTLAASGGSLNPANLTWSIVPSNLPPNVNGSAAGVISGTPSAGGTFGPINVSVHDAVSNQTATQSFNLTVGYAPITFNYVTQNDGLAPLGYFRLEATSGTSELNGYTYTATGATVQAGAPIGVTPNNSLLLNGTTGAVTTSLTGGITTGATMIAWVNLSQLPSVNGNLAYVAGEAQNGNDFDIQFAADNSLGFYTTNNGVHLSYTPNPSALVGHWHMIAATFLNLNGSGGLRALYWDGVQVANDTVVSTPNKTTAFNIGATPVFPGRNFPGAIDEAALWNRALSSAEVAELFASASAFLPPGVNGITYLPVTLYPGGGSGTYTFAATGLPPGLSLSSGGVLNGVPGPSDQGQYPATVTITDSTANLNLSPTLQIVINPSLAIQSQNLPTMTNNVPYSDTISVTGGLPPYTFTVASGSLPLNGTLNASTGVVSGTPSLTGYPPNTAVTGTFTVTVTDSTNTSVTSGLIGWIVDPSVVITTTSLASADSGFAYSMTLGATGGMSPYTWSITSGSLPAGLSLNPSSGAITGTPTVTGTFPLTIQVTDSLSNTAVTSPSLVVLTPPAITTTSLPGGTTGVAYPNATTPGVQLVSTGGAGGYVWSVSSGSLPAGITLSAAGVLGGTPTATANNLAFTAKVTDSVGGFATQPLTVTIIAALSISPASLPNGATGVSYNQTLTPSGGSGSGYVFTIQSGSLPTSLSLSPAGAITGTPSAGGVFNFVVQLTDSSQNQTTKSYSITVAVPVIITTTSLPTAVQGTPYSFQFNASGGSGSGYTWTMIGSLPAGLSLSSGGALTGTPTAQGTTTATVQVTDSQGDRAQAPFLFYANLAGTVITTNLSTPNSAIINIDATLNGAAGSSGPNQIYWTQPFNSNSQLIEYTIQPGNYSFRVVNPADAGTLNPGLTPAQLSGIFTGWTYNTPWIEAYLVFDSSAVSNNSETQIFSGAEGAPGAGSAAAAYASAVSLGTYNEIFVGARNATPTMVYTFTQPQTLIFVVPDYGLSDNGGGVSVLIQLAVLSVSNNSPLPVAVQNSNYSLTLTASDAIGATTWQVVSGSLPAGLSVNPSTGAITGSPGVIGGSTFTVQVTDSTMATASKQLTLTVNAPLTISTTSLPVGAQGEGYLQNLAASGGSGTDTWAITTGSLPAGVSFGPTGQIGGTPSVSGSFSFTVQATDANQNTATQPLTLLVNPALTITTTMLTAVPQGASVNQTLAAAGGIAPYTWSLYSGSLPTGVTLSAAGALGGTANGSTSTFFVQVSDSTGFTVIGQLTFTVIAPLSISPNTSNGLAAASFDSGYNQTLTAVGGVAPYTWAVTAGTVTQVGLSLNPSTGAITGLPETVGVLQFTVQVTDSAMSTASQSYNLTITPGGPPTYDFAVASTGSSSGQILRVSDLSSRNAAICSAATCPDRMLTADSQGNIYARSTTGIQKITPGGVVSTLLTFSTSGSALANSAGLGGIALDGLGNIIFVDNSVDAIFRVGTDGTGLTQVASFPTMSPTEAQDTWVRVDSGGNYIVVDDANSQVAIYRFTTGGQVSSVLDGAITGSQASGFVIDSHGNYDYLDYDRNQIVSVNPNGNVSTYFNGAALSTGTPLGLAVDPGSDALIAGITGVNALLRITSGGAVTLIQGGSFIGIGRVSDITVIPPYRAPLTITPTSLPTATAGQTYDQAMTASGGSGNYTWMATGLPSGITMSSAGLISGAAGFAGTSSVQITATDTVTSQTGTVTLPFTVSSPSSGGGGPTSALTISGSASSVNTVVGGSVSATFSGNGGAGGYTFSATGLPPGVTVSASGALSGSPSAAGDVTATVTVTDSHGAVASTSIAVNVLGINSGSLPAGTAGKPYSTSIPVVGGSSPFSFGSTGLPAGLSISQTGVLSGTVETAGTDSFTVKVIDATGLTVSGSFTVIFAAPGVLTITTSSLGDGNVGSPYSAGLSATGGFSPYTWSIAAGSPPAGLSLSSAGILSGTPTVPGSFSFGAMVTDTSGGVRTATIAIAIQPAPLTITTGALPAGINGSPYPAQVFNATGGTGSYTWAVSGGTLPATFALSSGGSLTGNPSGTGSFSFTVKVTDSATNTATSNYTLTIGPAALNVILSTGSLNFGLLTPATSLPSSETIGVQSSQEGNQITYSAAVNPPVPWMTLSNGSSTPDTMQVSLTPAALTLAVGTYSTTITATCTSNTCSTAASQSASVTLTVTAAPPSLQVTTDLLAFGLSTASGTTTETITIKNAGGGSMGIASIGCEAASFCTVGAAPQSLAGGVSAAIPISINASAAGVGFQRTQVDISTSAGKGAVPVTVLVANAATMALAPVGQQYTMQVGGAPGNSNGSVLVTVANGASASWAATVTSPTDWLLLGTPSGTASPTNPGTLTYSIGPTSANLAAGTYYGSILVTSSGVINSPLVFEVVLSVTPAQSTVAPDPEPGGLLFITNSGVTPPAQTVNIYAGSTTPLTYQAAVAVTSGNSWLSINRTMGTTSSSSPGSDVVTVNPTGLAPGTYLGGISYSLSAAAVRTVNVTLIVTAPGSQSISGLQPQSASPRAGCTGTTLVPATTGLVSNFAAAVAWPTPLSVVLADNCGNLLTNGQIVATFSNGDPPLPLPLANPTNGTYSGTWTPRSASAQVTITAKASAPNYPNATAQIAGATTPNAAPVLTPHGTLHSFDPIVGAALAPGTIVQIYGQNLSSGTTQPATIPLPTSANGTSVIIGGIPAPLYYVSAGQINAQVPFELNGSQPYQVVVSANGALATPDTLNLTAAAPGLAAFSDSTLIAQHGDGSLVSATAPAKAGEYLVAYLAGMGGTNATPASGAASPLSPLALPTIPPTLTINGAPSPIAFAGLTPGLVGLYQLNFQVPAGLPAGDITIVVTQSGQPSNHTVLPYTP